MSAAPPTAAQPVLIDRALTNVWVRAAVLVFAGAMLTAVTSQIRIPLGFSPVPITGGTSGVLLAGAALGPLRGTLSQALYVAFGLLGWPFFAGGEAGTSGLDVVLGTSGGYFVGFVIAAGLAGVLARRGWDRGPLSTFGAFAAGSVLILVLGTVWLGLVAQMGPLEAVMKGAVPFLIGDALKSLAAAAALPLAWKAIGEPPEDQPA
jgi:biotin transport system substrate-specific component